MNYWIHRCAYMGGYDILDNEHRLTIGFSDCAMSIDMVTAVKKRDGDVFDKIYELIYSGGIRRTRWSLWYFTCEMAEGDIVVVPRQGGFSVCRLKGRPFVSERRKDKDIGWEWEIEPIIPYCSPRESFAPTSLLSRMKCRQTTLNIGDLGRDVECAIERFQSERPFTLNRELTERCHQLLDANGSPDHFEKLLLDYFIRLGASAEILPKNYSGKAGDCDVSAVFSALKLTISVQAKKHWGKTDDGAILQIVEYSKLSKDLSADVNWAYINWVVSFADEFTDKAKEIAKAEGVILINGREFCEMMVSNGIGNV